MPRILTLTLNPAVDGSCEAAVVHPIHKVRTRNERYDPGGGGINVARVVRRLGDDVSAWYLAGGATGSVLDELLDRDGITRHPFPIMGHTRISHAVYETSTGQEYRFVPEGPDVSSAEWQPMLAALEQEAFDWLVVSGSLPRGMGTDDLLPFLDLAAQRDARLVLDTSGDALAACVAHGGLSLVKPSRGELERLAGRSLADLQAVIDAAAALVSGGKVEMVAVTLGHEGAVLVDRDGALVEPAIDVPVKSATGAGDSFLAGMVHALTVGQARQAAFRYGMAAGTAAVMTPGTDLCWPEDIARIFAQISA